MNTPDREDVERLARRIALLVSQGGEADNAGRAAGALARKLGLSGGDLKDIVLAGFARAHQPHGLPADGTAPDGGDVSELRARLGAAEHAMRQARGERDALYIEVQGLREALGDRRRGTLALRLLGGAILPGERGRDGAVLPRPVAASAVGRADRARATVTRRPAQIRPPGAVVRERPDTAAPAIARLDPGRLVIVHQLVWNVLLQWAEVDVEGRRGFVATTDWNCSDRLGRALKRARLRTDFVTNS